MPTFSGSDSIQSSIFSSFISFYRAKLGLKTAEDEDEKLVDILLAIMESIDADYTQTFRDLSELSLEDLKTGSIPESAWGLYQCTKNKELTEWLKEYVERVERDENDDEQRMEMMQKTNPRYILRNWIAQKAIEMAEQDDFSEVQFLLELFKNPFKINKIAEQKGYAQKPPGWSKRLTVSCSS